jgi:hypothetical protein
MANDDQPKKIDVNDAIDYYLADERIDGLDAIRRAIDPKMSPATFTRKWRMRVEPILMEYERFYLRDPPVRYFTFRRLLYGLMLMYRKI